MTPIPPPLDVMQAVDAACDRFEKAWAEATGGETDAEGAAGPRCEDFAAELPDGVAEHALPELFALERHFRADRGEALSVWAAGRDAIAALVVASRDEQETLADPASAARLSGGLRVVCPQCSVGVDLPPDAPLDEVSCSACGSTFGLVDRPGKPAAAPPTVGRFLLRERLGVGGFGAVWRARDPQLDRDVAIKLPRRGQLTPHETELFFREARAAAQLRHPGIVAVYEVGRDDGPAGGGSIYLVSELVDGEPLSSRLDGWRPTPRDAARLAAEVADALHYAHERGVIHRDLKPANIMLDRFAAGADARLLAAAGGRPRLMDFGLAKRETGEVTLTVDGQVLGTPAYMSPEQASGSVRWVDRRTDVYSLGVVLFRLLTGELPYRGTASSQIQQRQTDDAPSPRTLDPETPADLATVCLKCLERDPNARYATAAAVGDELRRYLAGEPILARPLSVCGRAGRWARRRPAVATAIGLASLLAVLGPAAAVTIESQRGELAERVESMLAQADEEGRKIDRLQRENDRLRGGAETRADAGGLPGWRRSVLRTLVADREEEFDRMAVESDDPETLIALAKLYAAVGRRGRAVVAAERAESLLVASTPPGVTPSDRLLACRALRLELADDSPDKRSTLALREQLVSRQRARVDAMPDDAAALVALIDLLATRRGTEPSGERTTDGLLPAELARRLRDASPEAVARLLLIGGEPLATEGSQPPTGP